MSMQGTREYAPGDGALAEDAQLAKQVQEARQRYLLLDKRPAPEIAAQALEPMQRTSPRYWIWLGLLGCAVLVAGATWPLFST